MSAPRAQRGFSLLEVVIAFAVLALSLGALYQSVGGSVRGVQEVERRAEAALLARSLLDLYDSVPEGGLSTEGVAGNGAYWRLVARPEIEPAGDGEWPLYRIEIEVWPDREARGQPLRVATLRPEREPEELAGR